jgi:hypothetical protein
MASLNFWRSSVFPFQGHALGKEKLCIMVTKSCVSLFTKICAVLFTDYNFYTFYLQNYFTSYFYTQNQVDKFIAKNSSLLETDFVQPGIHTGAMQPTRTPNYWQVLFFFFLFEIN